MERDREKVRRREADQWWLSLSSVDRAPPEEAGLLLLMRSARETTVDEWIDRSRIEHFGLR